MRKLVFAVSVCAGLFSGGHAVAQQNLRDVAEVTEGLIAVGIAYEISEVCGSLEARLLRGVTYLNQLRGRARELGFSRSEIDAYIKNDAEKKHLEGIARQRLGALGATPGDAQSHCIVGRREIAQGSTIGYFLK